MSKKGRVSVSMKERQKMTYSFLFSLLTLFAGVRSQLILRQILF
jgi:hypothetical protein